MNKTLFRITAIALTMAVFFTSTASALSASFKYKTKVEKALFSVSGLEDYVEPETPAFDEDKGQNSFTTVKECSKYLKKLAAECPYMHVYSKESLTDVPVVFFTAEDMSAAESWEDAAAVLTASGKVNVLYQAGLHGNEPAGAEGALYVLQRIADDPEYAAYLAENINHCVVPCANPDAAKLKARESSDGFNTNRDNLYVGSRYTLWLHQLYNAIMPEVVMDSHECLTNMQLYPNAASDYFTDVYLAGTSSLNIDSRINKWSTKLRKSAMTGCSDAGLRVSIYDSQITEVNNTVSRTYYGLYGSACVLIETMGINLGKSHLDRRVYSHYMAVRSILDTVIENKDTVKEEISAVRSDRIEAGKTFSSDNGFVLEHGSSGDKYTSIKRNTYSSTTGKKVSSVKYKVYWYDEIKRSRALPTAYIISKKAKNADRVVKKLRYSGIECFELEAGTSVKASQFKGDGIKAKILKAKTWTFSAGAYVVPMDQAGAMVIAAALEPDVTETLRHEGTFVQAGLLDARYIYRYTGSNPREKLLGMTEETEEEITTPVDESSDTSQVPLI
ncbi:MAG: hypothetical protein IKK69_06805 [Firmicutes bacterium]|nr:hypothetical protein [Bacillota bacterium]